MSIDGTRDQSVALKDTVASYTAGLVDALASRARHGRPVLPASVGLNVNYPGPSR